KAPRFPEELGGKFQVEFLWLGRDVMQGYSAFFLPFLPKPPPAPPKPTSIVNLSPLSAFHVVFWSAVNMPLSLSSVSLLRLVSLSRFSAPAPLPKPPLPPPPLPKPSSASSFLLSSRIVLTFSFWAAVSFRSP